MFSLITNNARSRTIQNVKAVLNYSYDFVRTRHMSLRKRAHIFAARTAYTHDVCAVTRSDSGARFLSLPPGAAGVSRRPSDAVRGPYCFPRRRQNNRDRRDECPSPIVRGVVVRVGGRGRDVHTRTQWQQSEININRHFITATVLSATLYHIHHAPRPAECCPPSYLSPPPVRLAIQIVPTRTVKTTSETSCTQTHRHIYTRKIRVQ